MERTVSKTPKRVALFSPAKKLVAIVSSMTMAASILGVSTPSVMYACNGTSVACQGWYLRLVNNIAFDLPDDLGIVTLDEFDRLNNIDRPAYSPRKMRKERKTTEGCAAA
jgi:hypothetical protein